MPKKIFITCLFLGAVITGILLSRRAPQKDTAPVAANTPVLSPSAIPPNPPAPSPAPFPTPLQPTPPVTLQDISTLYSPAESNDYYQRLTSELIVEIFQLRNYRDEDRIASRLNPVAQKFYYLKKRHLSFDDAPPFHLPPSFRQSIRNLEDLWIENPILARTTDSLFAQMDLLDMEHIPYQLREKIVARATDQ